MADDVTLLPCKCGTRPEVSQEPYTRRVAIFCAGCGEVTRFYDTASEAYDAWNEARRNDAVAERDARIAALEAQLAEARDWSSTLADAADDLRAELREAQQILAAMQAGTCVTCKHCEQWTTSDGEPRAACTRLSDDHKVIEFVMAERDFCSRWREKGDT